METPRFGVDTPRMRRILTTLLTAAAAAAVLSTAVPAHAGTEWRSMTGGIGWRPCKTIVVHPNPAGGPPTFLQELAESVQRINAATGVSLLAVGDLTTKTGKDLNDGQFVVSFTDLAGSAAGTAWLSWTTSGGAPLEIVAADVALDAPTFATTSREQRIAVTIHELGHALGLAHVGDAHEALSNGFLYSGGVGPGTTEALRRLYNNGACTVGVRIGDGPDGHAWNLPGDYRGHVGSVTRRELGNGAGSVRDLGVHLATASTQERGPGWARIAVVCRDDVFADCLAGAALAGKDGPVVFVPGGAGGSLPANVRVALQSALPPSGTVYVLGGEQAVSRAVTDALRAVWPDTRRLSGPSRIETAVAVAREVVARRGRAGVALVARDDDPADAVTGGAAAGTRGLPILLTSKAGLHGATAQALAELGISRTLMLGGTAALEQPVEDALRAHGRNPERVFGRSRTETSVAIARHGNLWARTTLPKRAAFVGLNGYHAETWALALSVAPFAAYLDAPVLLTTAADVPIGAPVPGRPGEPGWYLSHLLVADGASPVDLTFVYVGIGRWSDRHAAESFRSYVLLGA